MSTFTMRLKDVIDHSPNGIGLGVYPIFDEAYRSGLNTKIVNHFWNQEIGVESLSVFRFNLARKMNEIMPYYNQMFLTERIKFDPLATVDITAVANNLSENFAHSDGLSDSTGNNVAKAITVNSDFPQTALDENDTGNFASSSTESNSDADTVANVKDARTDRSNGRDDSTQRTKGFSGAASDLLMRYRATILNIDMAVIADLQELFMSVWDTGDTYTENGFIA